MERIQYYKNTINEICEMFNTNFDTNYKVILLTHDELKNMYPNEYNYINSMNTNNNFCLEEIGGYYNQVSKSIFIFYDKIKAINDYNSHEKEYDDGLTYLIRAVFHELEHRLQFEHPNKISQINELDKFKINIENILTYQIKEIDFSYKEFHDDLFIEIDADKKAIINSLAFSNYYNRKVKYGKINIDYYKKYETYNNFREKIYDIPFFIKYYNKAIKTKPRIFLRRLGGYFSNPNIYEFYKEDGEFKTIEEIMYNKKINECNPIIRASIICSEDYIKTIYERPSNLEDEKILSYLIAHAKLIYEDYNKRKQYYDRNKDKIDLSIFEFTKAANKLHEQSNKMNIHYFDTEYYEWLKQKINEWENKKSKIENYKIPNQENKKRT